MKKLYTWTHDSTGIEMTMTSEDMENAYNSLNLYTEDLAQLLTGITADDYADRCEELNHKDDTEEDDYKLCEAFHRLLNATQSDDTFCQKNFQS